MGRRRTHTRLARPLPTPRQGLGENHRKLQRLDSRRQHQAPLTQARKVLLSNVKFLSRALKADVDDPREQANHDMRFVLKSAFQLLRAARVTKLELIVRASAAEPRPQQAAWAGSRPRASTPRREV